MADCLVKNVVFPIFLDFSTANFVSDDEELQSVLYFTLGRQIFNMLFRETTEKQRYKKKSILFNYSILLVKHHQLSTNLVSIFSFRTINISFTVFFLKQYFSYFIWPRPFYPYHSRLSQMI